MGRTEKPTDGLQASRGHRHWAKEIRRSQTLFGVSGEVRSKNNLTEPALLEMSGKGCQLRRSTQHFVEVYSLEFGILEFFGDADLTAAPLGPDPLGYSRTGQFS